MKPFVKAGRYLAAVSVAGVMLSARGQTASAPAAGAGEPGAARIEAVLPDLANNDFVRREAGQRELEKVPVEQFQVLVDLAEKQTDPEVKARLDARVVEMLKELRKSPDASLKAVAIVADLMAMPSSQEDPGGTRNAERLQLIRDIGKLGDAAIAPARAALGKAKTEDQQREMVSVIGSVQTPASTRALIDLLTEKKDAARRQAIESLTDRLGVPAEKGGSDDVLPALAKILPGEKDESARENVCARMTGVLLLLSPATKPDPKRVALAVDLLRERLENDTSERVRFVAAARLTEFDDYSGLGELKKAAVALEQGDLKNEYGLDLLVPALERATGETFGKVPLNPMWSSDGRAVPKLEADRRALMEKVAAWVKAH